LRFDAKKSKLIFGTKKQQALLFGVF